MLTEVNILNLIEQRLARIGVDTSDVKEKLINKLTAKALADRSMVASVSDRLRDSSIFLDSVSQRIREFVIHGEGAPHLERAISDRVTEFNLEAQISNEVRNYVARGRDIHGVATNAAANARRSGGSERSTRRAVRWQAFWQLCEQCRESVRVRCAVGHRRRVEIGNG